MPAQNQNYQRQETHASQQARLTARNGDILAIAQRGNVKIVYYKYNPNSTTQNTSGNTATQSAANETHATQQTGFGYIHPTKRRNTEDSGEYHGRRLIDADADDEDEGEDGDDEEDSEEDSEVENPQRQESARRRPVGMSVSGRYHYDYNSEEDDDDGDEQSDGLEDEDEGMPDYPSLSPTQTIETRREKEMSRQRVYDDVDVGFDADESEVDGESGE